MKHIIIDGTQGSIALTYKNNQKLPVLFIHADPGKSAQWTTIMNALSVQHSVASFDARGAGQSDPANNNDYSYAGRATDIKTVIDALSFEKVLIVGHSGGAAVAMEYASKNIDRVVGLFLIDPPTDSKNLPRKAWDDALSALAGTDAEEVFMNYVASIAGETPSIRAQIIKDAQEISPQAWLPMTEALSDWNAMLAFEQVKAPVFLLTTPTNNSLLTLWGLDTDNYAVSNTNNHWIQLEEPNFVIEQLELFLKQLGSE